MSSAATAISSHTRSKSLRVPASDSSFLKRPVAAPTNLQQQAGPSHVALFLTNLRLLDLDRRQDWPGITPVTFTTKDSQQNIKKRIQCVEWALFRLFEIWDPEEAREKLQPFFPPLEPLQSLNLRTALFRCLDQAKKNGTLGRDAVLRKTMLDECKGERLEEVLSVFSTAVVKRSVRENQDGPEAIALRLAMENFSYTGDRASLSALVLAHKGSLRKKIEQKDRSKEIYNDFSGLLELKDRQITRRKEQLKVAIEEDENTEYISKTEMYEVQERARKNWYGSNDWLESILQSDRQAQTDTLLSEPYDQVWKYVEKGRIGEIEDSQRKGLLQQLDARVKEQKNRYETWQNFEKSIKARRSDSGKENVTISTKPAKDLSISFGAHESLQLPSNSLQSTKSWQPLPEQAELLANLERELAEVGKPKQYEELPRRRVSTRGGSLEPQSQEPVSRAQPQDDEKDWESNTDSDKQETLVPQRRHTRRRVERRRVVAPPPESSETEDVSDSDDQTVVQETPVPQRRPSRLMAEHHSAAAPPPEPFSEIEETDSDNQQFEQMTPAPQHRSAVLPPPSETDDATDSDSQPVEQATPVPNRQSSRIIPIYRTASTPPPSTTSLEASSTPSDPPSPPAPRILSTISDMPPPSRTPSPPLPIPSPDTTHLPLSTPATSPSPPKPRHILSLAERTRMSMSRSLPRTSTHEEFESPPDLPAPRLSSSVITDPEIDPAAAAAAAAATAKRHEDLLARTRQSMSNSAAVAKSAQLERRRSVKTAARKKRESFMPVRQSLAPFDEYGLGEEGVDREALIEEEEVDMEAVFMSRPRVKTSPASSPRKAWGEMGGRGEEGSLSPGG
ncbi:hypothetical protein VE02_02432 [Pseudogymnoascus sp. 03VT05]|nr:hypothetical protein VE02_02432 [Pseudogymnoascus sp. 03VT05]